MNRIVCYVAGSRLSQVVLGGAYSGSFPTYLLRVRISALGFDRFLPVVGISQNPQGSTALLASNF